MQFEKYGFSSKMVDLIAKKGYTSIYPIQEKVIPLIQENQDVLGIAKTGSGKTASFVLPIISSLKKHKSTSNNRNISVLVLVPTRELAIQVSDVFIYFKSGADSELKIKSVFGGSSINPQMKAMKGVDILVATPGRLIDLVDKNAVNLSFVKVFVLDEADKMLNLGFKDEMEKILSLLPRKKQNLLFSATLNKNIEGLSKILLKSPIVIQIDNDDKRTSIKQISYLVEENKKGPFLRSLILQKNMEQVLIFASSTHQVKSITNKLNKNGINAVAFHGKKSQSSRVNTLSNFKSGKIRVLVATDILSRGIDILELPFVINYDLPRSPKEYVHRIGRTGRAGAKGEAISLISPKEMHHFKIIQKKMGYKVEMVNSFNLDLISS